MKEKNIELGPVLGNARDLIRDKWTQGEFIQWMPGHIAPTAVCSVGAMRYAFSQAMELPYSATRVVEHPGYRRAMHLLAQAFARMDVIWIRHSHYLPIRERILAGDENFSTFSDLIIHINDQGSDCGRDEELHKKILAAFDEAVEAAVAEDEQRRLDALEQELRELDVVPFEEPVQV